MAPTLYSHWINFSILCSHEATWKLRCKHFVNNNATKMKKKNPLWFVHNDVCVANTAFVYTNSIFGCHLFNPWKDVVLSISGGVVWRPNITTTHSIFTRLCQPFCVENTTGSKLSFWAFLLKPEKWAGGWYLLSCGGFLTNFYQKIWVKLRLNCTQPEKNWV